jgi:malate/lactate dehydrogenase
MYGPANEARKRREEAVQRGLDPDKQFDIILISGSGGVGQEAVKTIANRLPLFLRPIEHIYLVGRELEGSTQKRELTSLQGNELTDGTGRKTQVQTHKLENLEALLSGENEKIAIFSLDNNDKGEINRAVLSANNIPLLENIAQYIPSTFKGNFNIASNLVEVLATRASQILPIDARLISGNTGIDTLRGKEYLKQVLPPQQYFDIELGIAGFHDQQYISLDATKIITHTTTLPNGREQAEFVTLREFMKKQPQIKDALIEYLTQAAAFQFQLDNKFYKAKKIQRQEGSTIVPTGRAIADFAQAVVNRTKTIASIPKLVNGSWFYVSMPVDFKDGYPSEDTTITNNFTTYDKEQIKQRILSPKEHCKPNSLHTIILETKFHMDKKDLSVQPPQESSIELEELFGEHAKTYTYADESARTTWEEQDLKESLQRKLRFELSLLSGLHQNCFNAYRYDGSDRATARTYQIQLPGTNFQEKKYLLDRTSIQRVIADEQFFYIAGITETKSNPKSTIRVQRITKFNGNEGQNILEFERIKGYNIEDMVKINNDIYLLQFEKDHHTLSKFNKRGREEYRLESDERIYGMTNHKGNIILIGEDYIYKTDGKQQTRIAENTGGREYTFLPEHNLLITAGFHRANIIDVNTQRETTYATKGKIGGIVANQQEIQLITKEDEAFIVRDFKTPRDVFEKNHTERSLAINKLLNANKIIVPEKNILISFQRPDKAFATMHTPSGYYTTRLDDISTFNLFGGYWR